VRYVIGTSSLADLFKWALDNPLYGLGILLGLALGIFYGFDGWRGSTEELELSQSPRVKNLLWVLTGALTTIVGDIRAVDESAKKPVLLLVYCAAVLAGAVTVVLVWGMIVAIDTIGARKDFGLRYAVVDALGDYFFFGYRKYRERKVWIASKQSFHREYLEQLANSIAAAGADTGKEKRLEFVRNILRSMTAVVLEYRGRESRGKIRSNLMLVRPCTGDREKQVRFRAEGEAIEECLELVTYHNEEIHDVVLPLPRGGRRELAIPGAPAAVAANCPVVVDDTEKIIFPETTPDRQKAEIKAYFNSKLPLFKSFASLCVVGKGRVLGVVNIDCSEKNIFGRDDDEKAEIIRNLLPFCMALGILINRD
jgi:hypothetical protein